MRGWATDVEELVEGEVSLAAPIQDRRGVTGLHPDRAPTIVAGMTLLRACVRAFGVDRVEVSEHDLLRGAALRLVATR